MARELQDRVADVLSVPVVPFHLSRPGGDLRKDDEDYVNNPDNKSNGEIGEEMGETGDDNDKNDDDWHTAEERRALARQKAAEKRAAKRAPKSVTPAKRGALTTAVVPAKRGKPSPGPAKHATGFKKINHSPVNQLTIKDLDAIRIKFHARLLDDEVVKDDDKGHTKAMYLTNYIFGDVLGGARSRIIQLVKEYHQHGDPALSQPTASRAERLASDETLPPLFREFYQSISEVIRSEVKTDSYLGAFLRSVKLCVFYRNYRLVLRAAQAREPAITELLGDESTSQGRGFATVATEYFKVRLGIKGTPDEKAWSSNLSRARCLGVLTKAYGFGVLAWLPKNAYYQYVALLAFRLSC